MFVSPGSRGGRQQGGAGAYFTYDPLTSLITISNVVVANSISIGNSSVNVFANSTIIKLSNSTVNTHISVPTGAQYAGDFYLHANGSWVEVTAGPGGSPASRVYQAFTATGGQTTFTVAGGYNVGFIDVYINGVKLADDEITQDGSDVVLDVGAINGAIVEVVGYVDIPLEEITSVAAGSDTQVQFNDATVLNGTAGFTFTKGTNSVVIANTLTVGTSIVNTTIFSLAGDTGLSRQSAGSLSVGDGTVGSASGWLWANAILFSDDTDQVPALFRSGATLNVKLGDDSALTNVAAASVALTGQAGVGANVLLDTVKLLIGNSTVNTVSNSLVQVSQNSTVSSSFGIAGANVGANVILGTVSLFIGNSTVNTVANSIIQVAANSTVTSSFGIGGANVGANVILDTIDISIGNSTVNSVSNSLCICIANSTTLSNLSSSKVSLGANVFLDTVTLSIGNSTVNTVSNSIIHVAANSTVSSSFGIGGANVGANVIIGTVDIRIGNSTVNSVSNSLVSILSNSTVSSSFGISGANCGANVIIGTVNITIGNSTVNSVSNSLGLYLANSTTVSNLTSSKVSLGANVFIDTVTISVGNTTANLLANSILVSLANSTGTSNLQPLGLTVGSSVVNSSVISSGGSLLSANIQTNPQTGTTYTLVAADSGKVVTCNNASAITVTVPAGLPIGFRTMILQYGAGAVTVSNTGQTGASIFSRNSLFVTTAKWGTISVIEVAANTYVIDGSI